MLFERQTHAGKPLLHAPRDPDQLQFPRHHGQQLLVCESFHQHENPRMRKRGILEKLSDYPLPDH